MPSSHILHRTQHSPEEQISVLNRHRKEKNLPSFEQSVDLAQGHELTAGTPSIMQINVGKMCNQTCQHCHVDAGPTRKEIMTQEVMRNCLDVIAKNPSIKHVDLTGGAPEMNPHFRWLVKEVKKYDRNVMVRCNLTIILANPKYATLPEFYAENNIEIIASLPHFAEKRTDAQRGKGVFEQSIKALQILNQKGYGKENSPLKLHLVYNPSGAFLPAAQQSLERTFKEKLKKNYDIDFHQLFAITNMPIARFLDYLEASNNLAEYLHTLVNRFNPNTLDGLMCRNTLSVEWNGRVYDCDFNQMLNIPCKQTAHIKDFDMQKMQNRKIRTNTHCYGCTAGAGSSCGGEIT